MIHCLSCHKHPYDTKVIPYGSNFPIDTVKVYLISKSLPNSMVITGNDVEELQNNCKFAIGSKLYVVNGNDGSEVYTWDSEKFVLFTPNSHKSKLPSDYSEVNGFSFDGDSYFVTDLILTGDDAISFEYSAKTACNVVGSYKSGSANNNFSFYHAASAYIRYDGSLYRTDLSTNTRYKIDFTPTGFYVDSTLVKGWEEKSFTCEDEMRIGALPNSSAQKLNGALYGRIKVNDGNKFEGVPVVRISDNFAGYYDIVNGKFYTNQGTGTVTAL